VIRAKMVDASNAQPVLGLAIVAGTAAVAAGWAVARGGPAVAAIFLAVGALAAIASRGPFAMLLLWMAVSPFTQGRFVNLGRNVPDLSVDRVLLILAVLLVFIQWAGRTRTLRRMPRETFLLVAFLAWALVSVLFWRPSQLIVQLGILFQQFFLPICAYYLVVQVVRSERQVRELLTVSLSALIVLSLPTPLEEVTGVTVLGRAAKSVAGVVRVQSFTRAAWELGPVAGILLALSTHCLSRHDEPMRKRVGIIAVLLGSVAIFLTFLRASWLSAIAVFLITGVFNQRLRRWLCLVLVVAGLAVWASWPVIVRTEVWSGRVADPTNVVARQAILRQQLEMFLRQPVLGQGVVAEARYYHTIGEASSISHNMYMSVLLDFGLLGLLYFAAIAVILWRSVRLYRWLPHGAFVGRELVVALWAAVAAFAINAATIETRLFASMNTLFWLTLALLTVVGELAAGARTAQA